jgi:hypothetical protein
VKCWWMPEMFFANFYFLVVGKSGVWRKGSENND